MIEQPEQQQAINQQANEASLSDQSIEEKQQQQQQQQQQEKGEVDTEDEEEKLEDEKNARQQQKDEDQAAATALALVLAQQLETQRALEASVLAKQRELETSVLAKQRELEVRTRELESSKAQMAAITAGALEREELSKLEHKLREKHQAMLTSTLQSEHTQAMQSLTREKQELESKIAARERELDEKNRELVTTLLHAGESSRHSAHSN